MPFRAPPPAQHPSVLVRPTSPTASSPALQQRSPTTPPPLSIGARHHATLRLPKPPPPPKPLYLTARLGHNKIAAVERSAHEDEAQASLKRRKSRARREHSDRSSRGWCRTICVTSEGQHQIRINGEERRVAHVVRSLSRSSFLLRFSSIPNRSLSCRFNRFANLSL